MGRHRAIPVSGLRFDRPSFFLIPRRLGACSPPCASKMRPAPFCAPSISRFSRNGWDANPRPHGPFSPPLGAIIFTQAFLAAIHSSKFKERA